MVQNKQLKQHKEYWADIPHQADEFDDVALPDEVVGIMAERGVGAMAAWRIWCGIVNMLYFSYGVGSPCRTACTVCGSPPCMKNKSH